MKYSLQTYVEDYLSRQNILDNDGYSIRLSLLYYGYRSRLSDEEFLIKMHRLQTTIFINNKLIRLEFEKSILKRIDLYLRKTFPGISTYYSGDLEKEKRVNLSHTKLTIGSIIKGFKYSIESRSIDVFWESRKARKLRPKAEQIAQALFTTYTSGEFMQRHGIVLREVKSGVGFVDCMIIISTVGHLVETKILTSKFTGAKQLAEYMRVEQRTLGHLLIIDTLEPANKLKIPEYIDVKQGRIYIYRVDINPSVPSSLN